MERRAFTAEDALKTIREISRRVMCSPKLLLQRKRLVRDVTVKATMVADLQRRF